MKKTIHAKTSDKLFGDNLNKELKDSPPPIIYAEGPHYREGNIPKPDNNLTFEKHHNPLSSKGD